MHLSHTSRSWTSLPACTRLHLRYSAQPTTVYTWRAIRQYLASTTYYLRPTTSLRYKHLWHAFQGDVRGRKGTDGGHRELGMHRQENLVLHVKELVTMHALVACTSLYLICCMPMLRTMYVLWYYWTWCGKRCGIENYLGITPVRRGIWKRLYHIFLQGSFD